VDHDQSLPNHAGAEDGEKAKGLMALPFMRRAAQRQKAEAEDAIRQMVRDLEATNDSGGEGNDGNTAPTGRLRFSGGSNPQPLQQVA